MLHSGHEAIAAGVVPLHEATTGSEQMTAATTGHRVENAMRAWEEGTRRRRREGSLERAADAVLAAGGLFAINATTSLGLGLPTGRAGFTIGASLVTAGFAWMVRGRTRRAPVPRRAEAVRAAIPLRAEWTSAA
jgi:hypothetical protein